MLSEKDKILSYKCVENNKYIQNVLINVKNKENSDVKSSFVIREINFDTLSGFVQLNNFTYFLNFLPFLYYNQKKKIKKCQFLEFY